MIRLIKEIEDHRDRYLLLDSSIKFIDSLRAYLVSIENAFSNSVNPDQDTGEL